MVPTGRGAPDGKNESRRQIEVQVVKCEEGQRHLTLLEGLRARARQEAVRAGELSKEVSRKIAGLLGANQAIAIGAARRLPVVANTGSDLADGASVCETASGGRRASDPRRPLACCSRTSVRQREA